MSSQVVLYGGSLVVTDPAVLAQAMTLGLASEALILEVEKHLTTEVAQASYFKLCNGIAVSPGSFAMAVNGALSPRSSGLSASDELTFREEGGDPNVVYTNLNVISERISRVLTVLASLINQKNGEECLALAVAFTNRFKEDSPDFAEALVDCIDDFRDAHIWDVDEKKSDGEIFLFAIDKIMDDKATVPELHGLLVDPRDYFKSRELGSWPEREEEE